MKKSLSVFMLAMINVAAIGSVKNWPMTAVYGFSSLFFFLLAGVVFFLPTALTSAELATSWPRAGGVFGWVKEAFGHRTGFLAIWLLWVENVIWYPTILTFIAATLAYIIAPELAENKGYMVAVALGTFWGATLLNLRGMRISGWVSTIGVIFGTFIPAALIIGLGFAWYQSGFPLQISLTARDLIPDLSSPEQLVFFTGVLLSLCGIEMSAVHAKDVANPQKNYPRAILISALLILGMSVLGVLSIAFVVPMQDISLTAGTIQALTAFLSRYGLGSLVPLTALLLVVGAVASLSTWIVGPSRGLLAAAESGDLPPLFRRVNKQGMPRPLLIGQGVIVSLLSLLFFIMPTLNSAYWIMSVLVAQVYIVMYLLMFAAAIRLRYTKPAHERPYRVPGGKIGMWIIAGMGIASSLLTLVIGFFPPAQIPTGNATFYVTFLAVSLGVICLAPSLILRFKTPEWSRRLSHEGKEEL